MSSNLYPNSYQNNAQQAIAYIRGSDFAPYLSGRVVFRDVPNGVMVSVNINGLPPYQAAQGDTPPIGPHGFHIHATGSCEMGHRENPYTAAGEHFNPYHQPHGNHAGDFPVLFSNHGTAIMSFFTDRFKVSDILGKAVIIHQNPDDYRTQPAGASGKRIGCGIIHPVSAFR